MGFKSGLGVLEERNVFGSYRNSNPDCFSSRIVTIDCATPTASM